jgi:hypothetical protein
MVLDIPLKICVFKQNVERHITQHYSIVFELHKRTLTFIRTDFSKIVLRMNSYFYSTACLIVPFLFPVLRFSSSMEFNLETKYH